MPINPEQVATLSFNGTDTYYQPTGYIPNFPANDANQQRLDRSETISFIASCIQRVDSETTPDLTELFEACDALKTKTDKARKMQGAVKTAINPPLESRLIEGPDTRGTLVYSRIAVGTASLLGSILEGRTTLNIQGHSRGAIQSILVAHELDRIKKAFRADNADDLSPEQLFNVLCNSPDPAIKMRLERVLQPIRTNDDVLNTLKARFRNTEEDHDIRVNLCLLDPVPGNTIFGLPGIGWYDNRYFKVPAIVRNTKVTICENEDTACFDCVIPIAEDPNQTQVMVHKLLGHHGTLTGNPFGNLGESLESLGIQEATAEHAQIIALYESYDFLSANGTTFKKIAEDCPLARIYNQYHDADRTQRRELLLNAYESMKKNERAYKAFNNTVYISVFGIRFNEAFKVGKTRPVLEDVNHTRSSLEVRLPFTSDQFINERHAQLLLELRVGLDLRTDLRRCDQMIRLIDHLNSAEYTDRLNRALESDFIRKSTEEGVQSLVSELVQLYLQNNLSIEEKRGTLDAINQALAIRAVGVAEAGGENLEAVQGVAPLSPLETLKNSLTTNLNNHLIEQIERQVKAHYEDLASLVLSMRANRQQEDGPPLFFDNAFAKYKQFKLFKQHVMDLSNNIPQDTKLARVLSVLTQFDGSFFMVNDGHHIKKMASMPTW